MQRALKVILLPDVHFCHNLLIHSYPNKGYSQEFVKTTMCFLKEHIISSGYSSSGTSKSHQLYGGGNESIYLFG